MFPSMNTEEGSIAKENIFPLGLGNGKGADMEAGDGMLIQRIRRWFRSRFLTALDMLVFMQVVDGA